MKLACFSVFILMFSSCLKLILHHQTSFRVFTSVFLCLIVCEEENRTWSVAWWFFVVFLIHIFMIAGHSGRAVWGVGLGRLVAGIVGSVPAQGIVFTRDRHQSLSWAVWISPHPISLAFILILSVLLRLQYVLWLVFLLVSQPKFCAILSWCSRFLISQFCESFYRSQKCLVLLRLECSV
jgi:hypothetical protein